MQYSVVSQGVIEFKQKIEIEIPWILFHFFFFFFFFFYNDDYSIDVHIDESNFSYIQFRKKNAF